MKISPMAGAGQVTQPTGASSQSQAAARERAITILQGNKGQSEQAPVRNPSAVAPEEMSAIVPQQSGQASISEQPTNVEQQQQQAPIAEEPAKDVATSKQWAQLARQEKVLRAKAQKQAQELQSANAALQAREEALKAREQEYSPDRFVPKARLQQSTLEALAEAGVTYDQIVEQQLHQQNVPPQVQAHINKLEAQIAKLTQSVEAGQKASVEQQQNAYKAALHQIRTDANKLITANPDFETIKATGSIGDVVELIEKTYQEDGVVLSVEEACQEVESHLLEEIEKLTKIDKIKKRISAASASSTNLAPTQTPVNQQTQRQPMKTLTNATGSTRPLTARERAVLAFEGKLK